MTFSWQTLRRWRWSAAGFAVVAAFAVLAGRFWHPHYGFTRFVQLDEADYRTGIPEIREHPVFVYEGFNGYDGAAYAQIAFHPLLRAPELKTALGNVPYRARRILGSAAAWLLAAGQPPRIASTYAAINLVVWLGFAFLLWRVLEVDDARRWLLWVGVVFSAGALHSVRLALTDLPAAMLAVAAVTWHEQGRNRGAIGALALAGLARETALANVVGLWRGPWNSRPAWVRNGIRTALVAMPLVLWMLYIRWRVGAADQGMGNFTWPVLGWIEKWRDTVADYVRHPDFRWLNTTTLLATIALTVQAIFFLKRPREDPWWRVGMVSVVLMAMIGTSVWEGHPGAATRVLLPMNAAFAVLAVRERAGWGWVLGGSLVAFAGVQGLWNVPQDPREIAAGRSGTGSFVARVERGWHGVEHDRRNRWAWTPHEGSLAVELATSAEAPARLRLRLRGITPREVRVRAGEAEVWRGQVETRVRPIEIVLPPGTPRRFELTLSSDEPPVRENETSTARQLGFALYGVELR
jgi:hypothetical protein